VFVLSAIVYFVAAFLLTILVNWIGLIPLKRANNAHWTEQARLVWPVRFTAAINVFVIAFLLNQLHWRLLPQSYYSSIWWLDMIAAASGAIFGCYPLDRQIFPLLTFKNWRRQVLAIWGIRLGIWAVLIAGILSMPEDFGIRMILVICGYLFIQTLLSWGLLLKYLRFFQDQNGQNDLHLSAGFLFWLQRDLLCWMLRMDSYFGICNFNFSAACATSLSPRPERFTMMSDSLLIFVSDLIYFRLKKSKLPFSGLQRS